MPELPEVETVRRGLTPYIEGQTIRRVRLMRRNLRYPFPRGFAATLVGARIECLQRRAKYLLAVLANSKADYWLSHLGMSGRFLWCATPLMIKQVRHVHVQLEFDEGTLIYSDPRRFGFMDLVYGTPDDHPRLATLGVEPLSRTLTPAYLEKAAAHRKIPIKSALLDQRLVAGLGNIYVCEALFDAHIHPQRVMSAISPAEWQRLTTAIKQVLRAAVKAGGSSLNDFADINGQAGYFQHRFKVYGRAGAPCVHRHCRGRIKSVKQAGRSSFYCSFCQI
ncbi:MAG: bifunctional DNA-formamidopyrimidine glycosylase/DNA-(apurinic or apyrimidinic site) lyase [Alphaproteobacteria bacterium]|nr:bifunctional DNA-formamidopyrimidine glycosylase/DNA-(apurinic or apyrimidinic site) lyase [Alphaproteobacteria bacterium]MBE8220301.1 bifunctional DNA-formamidopyrimidine glycosylase/DNA-(apurinic or apyrimidinic site) lyase [Alphaproteobacteria bacterium]